MTADVGTVGTARSADRAPTGPVWSRARGTALAAAGVLVAVGGLLHPHADLGADYDHALSGELHEGVWPLAHTLILAGLVVLAATLVVVVRAAAGVWPARVRLLGWWAVAGAALAVVEMVPHLLAYTQADDFADDGSAALVTAHTTIQLVSAPLFGVTIGALALAAAPERWFGTGRVLAALALLGGLVYGFAGIFVTALHSPPLSPLFAGEVLPALWLVVSGIRAPGRAPVSAR
jgi:hypothetical protein